MRLSLKTLIDLLAFIILFLAITSASCTKDTATTTITTTTVKCVTCSNGGACINDTCVCPSGYEGVSCETISRQKFFGNWSVFEKGSTSPAAQYPVSITEGSTINSVVIQNFYNYFYAYINATIIRDTILIPTQQYQGKIVYGMGYIYNSTTYGQNGAINMKYEVIDTATGVINDFGYNSGADHSNASIWDR